MTINIELFAQQRIYNGQAEIQRFLLSNADFGYVLIDHISQIDESKIFVPRQLVFFLQVLLHSVGDSYIGSELLERLAQFKSAPQTALVVPPQNTSLAPAFLLVKRHVLNDIVTENSGSEDQFDKFVETAVQLASSESYKLYAESVYGEIVRHARKAGQKADQAIIRSAYQPEFLQYA